MFSEGELYYLNIYHYIDTVILMHAIIPVWLQLNFLTLCQADWAKAACLHPSECPDGGNNLQELFEQWAPEGTPW